MVVRILTRRQVEYSGHDTWLYGCWHGDRWQDLGTKHGCTDVDVETCGRLWVRHMAAYRLTVQLIGQMIG
jgi:hypothetical protein